MVGSPVTPGMLVLLHWGPGGLIGEVPAISLRRSGEPAIAD